MAEKKIDNRTYSTTPILAKRAIVLQAKLAKVIGPALPSLIEAFAAKGGEEARQRAGVAALNRIGESLDPEKFGDLVEEIIELAEVDDNGRYRKVILDQDFDASNLHVAIKVVGFVLQEQFGDFFSALGQTGNRRTAAKA